MRGPARRKPYKALIMCVCPQRLWFRGAGGAACAESRHARVIRAHKEALRRRTPRVGAVCHQEGAHSLEWLYNIFAQNTVRFRLSPRRRAKGYAAGAHEGADLDARGPLFDAAAAAAAASARGRGGTDRVRARSLLEAPSAHPLEQLHHDPPTHTRQAILFTGQRTA